MLKVAKKVRLKAIDAKRSIPVSHSYDHDKIKTMIDFKAILASNAKIERQS